MKIENELRMTVRRPGLCGTIYLLLAACVTSNPWFLVAIVLTACMSPFIGLGLTAELQIDTQSPRNCSNVLNKWRMQRIANPLVL